MALACCLPGCPAAARQAVGRVHGARLQRSVDLSSPRAGARRALLLSRRGREPGRRNDLEDLRPDDAGFNLLGFLAVYMLQRLQGILPLNPQGLAAVAPDLSFNTAVSFASNTNWQGYGGETTMSYLTQMLALTVQNFVSAATGMAVLIALARGIARHTAQTIGNFWVDPDARHALHPAAAGADAGAGCWFRRAWCKPSPAVPDRQRGCCSRRWMLTATQTAAGAGRRPGGLADRHQAAGHQRRRLLQRQLGASVREPHTAVQLPGDVVDPADPGRAVLHLWQDGGRYAPGLGASWRP